MISIADGEDDARMTADQAAELPDLQVLRDFRIIQTLPSGPASDAELLAALQ